VEVVATTCVTAEGGSVGADSGSSVSTSQVDQFGNVVPGSVGSTNTNNTSWGWDANPLVAFFADAGGVVATAAGELGPARWFAIISATNDYSPLNIAVTGATFAPVVGETVGALQVVYDLGVLVGQWITNNVMAPVLSAAPPQMIDNGKAF
jgi:hypothetical protein